MLSEITSVVGQVTYFNTGIQLTRRYNPFNFYFYFFLFHSPSAFKLHSVASIKNDVSLFDICHHFIYLKDYFIYHLQNTDVDRLWKVNDELDIEKRFA